MVDFSFLNEEQLRAVAHPIGRPACLIAGAGSGKTATITARVAWLMENSVPPFRICCITFTNKAAGEIARRVGLADSAPAESRPHISTIHSLALSAIRRDPEGFGFEGKVTPMDDYDQAQMCKKLIERMPQEMGVEMNAYRFLEKLAYHRARGVGFSDGYTEEVHEEALEHHKGYHALEDWEARLWRLFEEEKRKCGTVDFDDMIHLVVRRGEAEDAWRAALQRRFHHVLQDESQDTSPVQWRFVNLLLGDDNPNLYCVGDLAQCQPPGTMLTLLKDPCQTKGPGGGRGMKAATYQTLPIELLEDCIRAPMSRVGGVISWTKADQRTYSIPRRVKIASRWYNGRLLAIQTANGCRTRVTPSHWLWVRFNATAHDKHMLYLMWREGYGYRVGISKVRTRDGHFGFGLTRRMNVERAHKAWVLRLFDTRAEAEAWEEIYSLKYGIPECVFEPEHACKNKTSDLVKLVFSHASPDGGPSCLKDHGLFADAPIVSRKDEGNLQNQHWHGYFKTIAANVLPLAGILDIPVQGINRHTVITSVTPEHYEGRLYSLDVDKDHTYIADGLVVGNSIYAFQGAEPRLLKEFSEGWRGHVPDLYRISRNHRSLPSIIRLSNKINAAMTEVIPLKMMPFRGLGPDGGEAEPGLTRIIRSSMPSDIAVVIAKEIQHDSQLKKAPVEYRDNAILVRSAIQVRDVEGALVRLRIPYIVRGGRGLLQTEEVKDILSYFRLAVNHKDFPAFVRAVGVPKRGIGDVAIERLRSRAGEEHGGDLVEACASMGKLDVFYSNMSQATAMLDDPAAAMEALVRLFGYKDYISGKYRREESKARAKHENIDRFLSLVQSLADEGRTSEDLVFHLAMDRPSDDGEEEDKGAVTVSTIHSAKGLEWRRVYITNVTEGSLPHRFSMGSPSEVEEERRLFYVACTRAKDSLAVCVHSLEPRGPNTLSVAPSRFLGEVGIRT